MKTSLILALAATLLSAASPALTETVGVSIARGETTDAKIWVPFELVSPANIDGYAKAK